MIDDKDILAEFKRLRDIFSRYDILTDDLVAFQLHDPQWLRYLERSESIPEVERQDSARIIRKISSMKILIACRDTA